MSVQIKDNDFEDQPLTGGGEGGSYSQSVSKETKYMGKNKNSYRSVRKTITTKAATRTKSLLAPSRLKIPKVGYQKLNSSSLVDLNSESDDEFTAFSHASTAQQVNRQLSRQLQKDGYQLDEMPDDEDLDLIPPSDFRQNSFCACCNVFNASCNIM